MSSIRMTSLRLFVSQLSKSTFFCFLSVTHKPFELEFVFLQKPKGLPPFWCHIVLYIKRTFILTNEIPREITKKYKCKSSGSCALHVA